MMNINDLSAYFTKVGLVDSPPHTVEGLTQLHNAQHRTMPFENLDIQLGRGVSLAHEDIIDKLVYHERGGYCFELNELMFQVLQSVGFQAKRMLARVHKGPEPTGRSHQFNLVELDNQTWIVDTGFGSHTPRAPLPLTFDSEIKIDLQTFRLIKDDVFGNMLQIMEDNEQGDLAWQNLYSFDMTHVCNGDIQNSNFFVSNYPESLFVLNRVVTFPLENGIAILFNHSLKLIQDGITTEIELKEDESYLSALKDHFGIELDAWIEDLKPLSN